MNFTEAKRAFLELYDKNWARLEDRFCRWAGGYAGGKLKVCRTQTEELLDMISDELRKFIQATGRSIRVKL